MHHNLSDLGSRMLIRIIPSERTNNIIIIIIHELDPHAFNLFLLLYILVETRQNLRHLRIDNRMNSSSLNLSCLLCSLALKEDVWKNEQVIR